jgi:hypothetical protein
MRRDSSASGRKGATGLRTAGDCGQRAHTLSGRYCAMNFRPFALPQADREERMRTRDIRSRFHRKTRWPIVTGRIASTQTNRFLIQ